MASCGSLQILQVSTSRKHSNFASLKLQSSKKQPPLPYKSTARSRVQPNHVQKSALQTADKLTAGEIRLAATVAVLCGELLPLVQAKILRTSFRTSRSHASSSTLRRRAPPAQMCLCKCRTLRNPHEKRVFVCRVGTGQVLLPN